MSTLDSLPGRALDLVTQVGEGIKNNVPDRAIKWIETGAALSALKTGSRVASKLVRRNPAVAVATAAGAGLVWYLIRRKQKQAENGAIEGKSKRVAAKRSSGAKTRAPSKRATRSKAESTS